MSYYYEPFNGFQNRSQFFQQNTEKFMSPFMTTQKAPVNVKEAFEVSVDVQQFGPNDLTVKVTDENVVTVEGKHGEKRDQHGTISRHFVRRYNIPEGYDTTKIESRLSSDGILTILVGKLVKEKREINVPIKQTFMPRKVTHETNGPTKMDINSNHQTVFEQQKMGEIPRVVQPNEKIIRVDMEQTPEREMKAKQSDL